MANALKTITMKWLQSMLEVVVFFPVILLYCLILLPHNKLWHIMVSLLLFSLVGLVLRKLFYTRLRLAAFCIGIPLVAFCNMNVLSTSLYLAASIPLSLIFLYRGIQSVERSWHRHFPIQLYWFGLSAYFLCYCLAYMMGYHPYLSIITYFGILSVFAFLFMNNQEQLLSATMTDPSHPHVSGPILKSNRLFIFVTFLLLILLTQINWIKAVIVFPFALLLRFINFIASSININELMPRKSPTPLQQDVSTGTSWLISFINIVIQVTGFLVSMLLVAAILVSLVKISKGLIFWFVGLFKLKQGEESTLGYTDEKESLLDTTFTSPQFSRLKNWLLKLLEKEPKWEDLKENRERIRYIYRHFIIHCISKGYHFKKHLTPNEIYDDITKWDKRNTYKMVHLTAAYNKARYATCEITDNEIEKMKKSFDNLKG